MPTLLEREIERAVEGTLSRPAAPVAPAPPVRRAAAPVVRFSPMFADAPPAARRRRRIVVAASIAVHVLVVAIVIVMPKRAQTIEEPVLPLQIVFTAPIPSIPETVLAPVLPKPAPKPKPKPKPRPEPRPEPPAPIPAAPKPIPKPVVPEPPAPPVAKIEPPRPRPTVRTGLLDETPAGPAIVASKTSRSSIVASGFDGTAGAASSAARPGRVVEVAFDAHAAASRTSRGSGTGTVQETGFGVASAAAVAPKRERAPAVGALDTEVEILSKPKPVYTDEARSLRIEGDVVLDVTFEAGGTLRVLGVAAGLGHGLDEAAVEAAKKIRFNPARRDGSPVDHTAKLRVVFRLA